MSIIHEDVLKLRCLYLMPGSRKSLKVALSIYHVCITKEEVLKLRCLHIMHASLRKKFESCLVHISCVDH